MSRACSAFANAMNVNYINAMNVRAFPQARLTVICQTPFATRQITAVTLEDFLAERG